MGTLERETVGPKTSHTPVLLSEGWLGTAEKCKYSAAFPFGNPSWGKAGSGCRRRVRLMRLSHVLCSGEKRWLYILEGRKMDI